jgi:capsular exopolysaccharide synthesis family protein
VEPFDDAADLRSAPAKLLNVKLILRAARRHWWLILVLWALFSGGLMALAYIKIKTAYTATALLEVKSTTLRIFDTLSTGVGDFGRYQKTQVELVTSPDVLGVALSKHPELAVHESLRGSSDPEAEIRRLLQVQIRPDTNLITVSMVSEDKQEAVEIVDAVVEAYLAAAHGWSGQESRIQTQRLKEEAQKLDISITSKRTALHNLVKKIGNIDPAQLRDQGKVSLERFQNYLANWDAVRLERIHLESDLESARLRAGRVVAKMPAQQIGQDQMQRLFYMNPQVAQLVQDKDRAQQKLEAAKRLVRNRMDPSVVQADKQVKGLNDKIIQLWRDMRPTLQQSTAEAPDENERAVQELEARVTSARNTENALHEQLNQMEIDNKQTGSDTLEVNFAKAGLDKDEKLSMMIQSQISQLEFEARGPATVDKANSRTQIVPSANKRNKVMAATPLGVLALLLGMFVLVEVRSGRVGDPDELPSRVRVEVIGVVPPLPSLRPSRALWGSRDEIRARRQFEEFMQSLDHLRVALCAGRRGGERRRCVLITSACSSEGKTTLAAHLAGRCANAGLSTLLIDADLRNPSLSRLLKVPEGPGLTDVLRNEATAESVMMVIEAGGGFHLLPAGTMGYDPSRLLQSDQLSQLLGQLRQAFDMVIMDAPPVLLVPDALTIGRCADGALLAVRYDTSRFPLVERAHRRLTAVGVPVIGAVVNGVRTMESSYGYYSYSYSYRADRKPASSATIDVPTEPTA